MLWISIRLRGNSDVNFLDIGPLLFKLSMGNYDRGSSLYYMRFLGFISIITGFQASTFLVVVQILLTK